MERPAHTYTPIASLDLTDAPTGIVLDPFAGDMPLLCILSIEVVSQGEVRFKEKNNGRLTAAVEWVIWIAGISARGVPTPMRRGRSPGR